MKFGFVPNHPMMKPFWENYCIDMEAEKSYMDVTNSEINYWSIQNQKLMS